VKNKLDNLLNKQVKEIEDRINAIQRSTKTLIPQFSKPHNALRNKFSWYETWHLNPWVGRIHATVLILYSVFMIGFAGILLFNQPQKGSAAVSDSLSDLFKHYSSAFLKQESMRTDLNYGNPYYNPDRPATGPNFNPVDAYSPEKFFNDHDYYSLSYWLNAWMFYYEKTGDSSYLAKAMSYVDRIVAVSPKNDAGTKYRPYGNWKYTVTYPDGKATVENLLSACHVHEGLVPVARLASIIKTTPGLKNNQTYNTKANTYIKYTDDILYDYMYFNNEHLKYITDNQNNRLGTTIPYRYFRYDVSGVVPALPDLRGTDAFTGLRTTVNTASPSLIWKDTNTNMAMTSLFLWKATSIDGSGVYPNNELYRDVATYYSKAFKKRITKGNAPDGKILWDADLADPNDPNYNPKPWWTVIHQGRCVVTKNDEFFSRRAPGDYDTYSCELTDTEISQGADGVYMEITPMHDTSHSNREAMMAVYFYENNLQYTGTPIFNASDISWFAKIVKEKLVDREKWQNEGIPIFNNYIDGTNGWYWDYAPYGDAGLFAGWAMLGKYDSEVNRILTKLFENISDKYKVRAYNFGINERGHGVAELSAMLIRNGSGVGPSNAQELKRKLNPNTNPHGPTGWNYWWDVEIPGNHTYREWFFNDIVPTDPLIYSMLLDRAIPGLWTQGFYYKYFFDTLVPEKTANSFYFDRFWQRAVPELWTQGFYYKRLWDKAVPENWRPSSSNPYYTTFWNQAVPQLWAKGHYYSRLWDKAVPQDWVPSSDMNGTSYKWTFWIKAVPLGWSSNFYQTRFWNQAVPNNWVSSYYTNTLNNSAKPGNWASGYYTSR